MYGLRCCPRPPQPPKDPGHSGHHTRPATQRVVSGPRDSPPDLAVVHVLRALGPVSPLRKVNPCVHKLMSAITRPRDACHPPLHRETQKRRLRRLALGEHTAARWPGGDVTRTGSGDTERHPERTPPDGLDTLAWSWLRLSFLRQISAALSRGPATLVLRGASGRGPSFP